MSLDRDSDDVVTVKVWGRLTVKEWRAAQEAAAKRLRQSDDSISMLVIVEDFLGWDRSEQWEDTSFQSRFDRQIDRLAVVADKKWKELVLMFVGKGLRRIEIEYFLPAAIEQARAWLKAAKAQSGARSPEGSKP
jgi:hypothetical protein